MEGIWGLVCRGMERYRDAFGWTHMSHDIPLQRCIWLDTYDLQIVSEGGAGLRSAGKVSPAGAGGV